MKASPLFPHWRRRCAVLLGGAVLAATALAASGAAQDPAPGTAPGAGPESAPAGPALVHDYPTYERVRYVLECINRNGGTNALMYQCSCAIDKLADRFSIDDFVELQTAANGSTIAGERGGMLRDSPEVRADARRYREAESAALRSCGVAAKH